LNKDKDTEAMDYFEKKMTEFKIKKNDLTLKEIRKALLYVFRQR